MTEEPHPTAEAARQRSLELWLAGYRAYVEYRGESWLVLCWGPKRPSWYCDDASQRCATAKTATT
jgi:hypothetical protein